MLGAVTLGGIASGQAFPGFPGDPFWADRPDDVFALRPRGDGVVGLLPRPVETERHRAHVLPDREHALAVAADMPDKVIEEPAADAQPEVIWQGQFQDADSFHQGSGEATIFQLPDGSYVLRFENFEVTNGPDLHVLLANHPVPADRAWEAS